MSTRAVIAGVLYRFWSLSSSANLLAQGANLGRATCERRCGNADWATYNGDPRGNWFTTLTQIDKSTVRRPAPRWLFSIPDAGQLQRPPVVVGGIMYVTARVAETMRHTGG